jgi:hypothetical protein
VTLDVKTEVNAVPQERVVKKAYQNSAQEPNTPLGFVAVLQTATTFFNAILGLRPISVNLFVDLLPWWL